jgi:hypothetical protein
MNHFTLEYWEVRCFIIIINMGVNISNQHNTSTLEVWNFLRIEVKLCHVTSGVSPCKRGNRFKGPRAKFQHAAHRWGWSLEPWSQLCPRATIAGQRLNVSPEYKEKGKGGGFGLMRIRI